MVGAVNVNVSETKKFTSNVTGEAQKNHKLNCDDNCSIYLLSCFIFLSVVENSMLGKQQTALGIDRITKRIMIERIIVRRAVCKNI